MVYLRKRIENYLLKKISYTRMGPVMQGVIYLTFDDGPEEGITEFVLNELNKYSFKATFFCRGDNAEKYPELLAIMRAEGHSIGNYTYSHLQSYDTNANDYSMDLEKADKILKTKLFRPPHGSMTFASWRKLHNKYHIYYWSLNSGDSDMENFNFQHSINKLKKKTKNSDIVLFHFCHRHERETRQILPVYLRWLYRNNFTCKTIELTR